MYHLKATDPSHWTKLGEVSDRIETARSNGQAITANIYTYTAGATGLDATMPRGYRKKDTMPGQNDSKTFYTCAIASGDIYADR